MRKRVYRACVGVPLLKLPLRRVYAYNYRYSVYTRLQVELDHGPCNMNEEERGLESAVRHVKLQELRSTYR